jgi:hypothetical protein
VAAGDAPDVNTLAPNALNIIFVFVVKFVIRHHLEDTNYHIPAVIYARNVEIPNVLIRARCYAILELVLRVRR